MASISYQKRQAKNNYEWYKKSVWHELRDAYANPSVNKERAWFHCISLMAAYNGHDIRIISRNTYMFTAGFEFEDKETGVCKFMYITPNYEIEIEL